MLNDCEPTARDTSAAILTGIILHVKLFFLSVNSPIAENPTLLDRLRSSGGAGNSANRRKQAPGLRAWNG
ncbi:hypothetical protein R5H32_17750 [Defluviimonas sp. D31]|uniref:hypothetical protein n=1 Tax=Defluviimonas sp. D31 TaxID=3083253 RepID=UPI00296E691E|nr:hypothetical protein [Defluviimonas sp. D31]MDW4551207.1 hypothetical protein [Defluviimonas sp. D31]